MVNHGEIMKYPNFHKIMRYLTEIMTEYFERSHLNNNLAFEFFPPQLAV